MKEDYQQEFDEKCKMPRSWDRMIVSYSISHYSSLIGRTGERLELTCPYRFRATVASWKNDHYL